MNDQDAAVPTPISSSQRLLDKVAIVTGASSGLGRAIALAYAFEGAAVVCADLRSVAKAYNEEDEKATHELIAERGGKSIYVKCDVSDSQSVQDLIEAAVTAYGRLDIMVNNAGVALETNHGPLPIHETSETTFDQTLLVNARSVFLGCKYAAKQMLKQEPHKSGDRGWIVNMASVIGLVGMGGAVSYAASKGAVVQITRTVALDLAGERVHCNAICPGFTTTSMIQPWITNEAWAEKIRSAHPFRGLGEPQDIARAAVFLASEDASWISGVPLPVDGGYVAR